MVGTMCKLTTKPWFLGGVDIIRNGLHHLYLWKITMFDRRINMFIIYKWVIFHSNLLVYWRVCWIFSHDIPYQN